jgi:hypothetical protein
VEWIADGPSAVVRHQRCHRLSLSTTDDNVIHLDQRRRSFEQTHVLDSQRFFPGLCVGTANVDVTVAGGLALGGEDFFGLRTSRFDFCCPFGILPSPG